LGVALHKNRREILFKQTNYIDENTSIGAHQSINVYGTRKKKYEVRIARLAVDVQIFSMDYLI
jgi:hypothetical protein